MLSSDLIPSSVLASPWNQQSAPGFNSLSTQQQQPAFPIGAPTARGSNNKTMTAAMFAQTKFGSTKLKTQAKRSNRLSPTDNFQRCRYPQNTSRTDTCHPFESMDGLDFIYMSINNSSCVTLTMSARLGILMLHCIKH